VFHTICLGNLLHAYDHEHSSLNYKQSNINLLCAFQNRCRLADKRHSESASGGRRGRKPKVLNGDACAHVSDADDTEGTEVATDKAWSEDNAHGEDEVSDATTDIKENGKAAEGETTDDEATENEAETETEKGKDDDGDDDEDDEGKTEDTDSSTEFKYDVAASNNDSETDCGLASDNPETDLSKQYRYVHQ
jgi:hypothetical protein